jgi:hypothetical protein
VTQVKLVLDQPINFSLIKDANTVRGVPHLLLWVVDDVFQPFEFDSLCCNRTKDF